MVPVDGTFFDFTLDHTLSSMIVSWHRAKGVASLQAWPTKGETDLFANSGPVGPVERLR